MINLLREKNNGRDTYLKVDLVDLISLNDLGIIYVPFNKVRKFRELNKGYYTLGDLKKIANHYEIDYLKLFVLSEGESFEEVAQKEKHLKEFRRGF